MTSNGFNTNSNLQQLRKSFGKYKKKEFLKCGNEFLDSKEVDFETDNYVNVKNKDFDSCQFHEKKFKIEYLTIMVLLVLFYVG